MNENEKPTFFVSRRGKQVGVHEVDMTGIDIESAASKAENNVSERNNTPKADKKPIKVKRQKNPWSKKKKLVLLTVCLLLFALPLLVAELVTAQYKDGISAVKADMKQVTDSKVLPAQKSTFLAADQVRTISSEVNQLSNKMCRGGLVDNIAQLYPRARQAHDACKESKSKYVSLVKYLNSLESQARYFEKVGAFIKPVSTPITDEFAVIGDQHAAWTKAKEELNTLNPPLEYKSVHSELVARVAAVSENWRKLDQANAAQDKTSFEDAEKNLTIEYEAVRATSSEFSAILSSTQTKVLNAYSATK